MDSLQERIDVPVLLCCIRVGLKESWTMQKLIWFKIWKKDAKYSEQYCPEVITISETIMLFIVKSSFTTHRECVFHQDTFYVDFNLFMILPEFCQVLVRGNLRYLTILSVWVPKNPGLKLMRRFWFEQKHCKISWTDDHSQYVAFFLLETRGKFSFSWSKGAPCISFTYYSFIAN